MKAQKRTEEEESDSSDEFDLMQRHPSKFMRFRSRSHYFDKNYKTGLARSSFEPVKEVVEEQNEEKRKKFPMIRVVADREEDGFLQPPAFLRLLSDPGTGRSRSTDVGLPKVMESNDEYLPMERKKHLKQYFAPIDKAEDTILTTNNSLLSRHTVLFSKDTIEENDEEDPKERSISLSISCKSGSQRKLKVDEIDEDSQAKPHDISEVVEEVNESESDSEKCVEKARLSRNLKKTHDSLRKITKGDLVCSNIVPFSYTDRPPLVLPDIDKIDEEVNS